MKTLITIISIFTLSLIDISKATALEVGECNNCSRFTMESLAINLMSTGSILIYDPENGVARKYLVSKDFEMPWKGKIAIQINVSTHESKFAVAMSELRKDGQGNAVTIPMNMSNYPGYESISAYDVYYNSIDRNQVSATITSNFEEIMTLGALNGTIAMAFTEAVLNALKAGLKVDMSSTFILTFEDGSTVVFNVDVENGVNPYHNRADNRNMDANSNQILSEVTSALPNTYVFTNADQHEDFVRAANAWANINLAGGGSGGSGGTMRCVQSAPGVLTCTYAPN